MSEIYSFRWRSEDSDFMLQHNLLPPEQLTKEEAKKLYLLVLRIIPEYSHENACKQAVLSQLELRLEHGDLLLS